MKGLYYRVRNLAFGCDCTGDTTVRKVISSEGSNFVVHKGVSTTFAVLQKRSKINGGKCNIRLGIYWLYERMVGFLTTVAVAIAMVIEIMVMDGGNGDDRGDGDPHHF